MGVGLGREDRSEMPKVTMGPQLLPGRQIQEARRGRGQRAAQHLSTCLLGEGRGWGLGQPGFSCCFSLCTKSAWSKSPA